MAFRVEFSADWRAHDFLFHFQTSTTTEISRFSIIYLYIYLYYCFPRFPYKAGVVCDGYYPSHTAAPTGK